MEGLQTTAPESSLATDQQFHLVANSVAKLLETARRELGRDQEAAKASLVTASHILQAEIERCSGAKGSTTGGLAAWQILRVRAYIDSNLHRSIHIRDLCAVARRSPAHFSRKFKLAVGESPHAYVVRRRLERACHLMMTSAASLARSPQQPAWTRISHERSARERSELRPIRTIDRKQTSDKWRNGRTARRARHGSSHRPGGARKQGRRQENPDRARLAKERSRTSQPARPQLRRARDLIGPI